MADLTIKNMPDPLYDKLKASAEANGRTVHSEVMVLMMQFLQKPKRNVTLMAAKATKLRGRTAHYVIDEAQLEAWINDGRR